MKFIWYLIKVFYNCATTGDPSGIPPKPKKKTKKK